MIIEVLAAITLFHTFVADAVKDFGPSDLDGNRRLGSRHEHDEYGVTVRGTSNDTVNWDTMPTCSLQGICNSVNGADCTLDGAIANNTLTYSNCYTFPIPCPVVIGQCTDRNGTTRSCPTYTLDCYCGLPMQLACSWSECSVIDWMFVEDWFHGQCPSVKPVDFSGLPDCTSSCFQDRSFSSGCINGGRNCFCYQNSFFNCDVSQCNSKDRDSTYTWYMDECNVTRGNAISAESNPPSNGANVESKAVNAFDEVHWYEAVAFAAGGITVILLIIGWFSDPIIRTMIHEHNRKTHSE